MVIVIQNKRRDISTPPLPFSFICPWLLQVKLFYGLSIENKATPSPCARLQKQRTLWERISVNCGVFIIDEIQWAFHFQYKPKLVKGSVWERLCYKTTVCIKITLYCFDMCEAKVKIIFLLDIVSVISPHCKASIWTSPEWCEIFLIQILFLCETIQMLLYNMNYLNRIKSSGQFLLLSAP